MDNRPSISNVGLSNIIRKVAQTQRVIGFLSSDLEELLFQMNYLEKYYDCRMHELSNNYIQNISKLSEEIFKNVNGVGNQYITHYNKLHSDILDEFNFFVKSNTFSTRQQLEKISQQLYEFSKEILQIDESISNNIHKIDGYSIESMETQIKQLNEKFQYKIAVHDEESEKRQVTPYKDIDPNIEKLKQTYAEAIADLKRKFTMSSVALKKLKDFTKQSKDKLSDFRIELSNLTKKVKNVQNINTSNITGFKSRLNTAVESYSKTYERVTVEMTDMKGKIAQIEEDFEKDKIAIEKDVKSINQCYKNELNKMVSQFDSIKESHAKEIEYKKEHPDTGDLSEDDIAAIKKQYEIEYQDYFLGAEQSKKNIIERIKTLEDDLKTAKEKYDKLHNQNLKLTAEKIEVHEEEKALLINQLKVEKEEISNKNNEELKLINSALDEKLHLKRKCDKAKQQKYKAVEELNQIFEKFNHVIQNLEREEHTKISEIIAQYDDQKSELDKINEQNFSQAKNLFYEQIEQTKIQFEKSIKEKREMLEKELLLNLKNIEKIYSKNDEIESVDKQKQFELLCLQKEFDSCVAVPKDTFDPNILLSLQKLKNETMQKIEEQRKNHHKLLQNSIDEEDNRHEKSILELLSKEENPDLEQEIRSGSAEIINNLNSIILVLKKEKNELQNIKIPKADLSVFENDKEFQKYQDELKNIKAECKAKLKERKEKHKMERQDDKNTLTEKIKHYHDKMKKYNTIISGNNDKYTEYLQKLERTKEVANLKAKELIDTAIQNFQNNIDGTKQRYEAQKSDLRISIKSLRDDFNETRSQIQFQLIQNEQESIDKLKKSTEILRKDVSKVRDQVGEYIYKLDQLIKYHEDRRDEVKRAYQNMPPRGEDQKIIQRLEEINMNFNAELQRLSEQINQYKSYFAQQESVFNQKFGQSPSVGTVSTLKRRSFSQSTRLKHLPPIPV